MITLVAGQEVAAAPGYFVAIGGVYQPFDLVMCSTVRLGLPVVAFLAIFIATGKNEE